MSGTRVSFSGRCISSYGCHEPEDKTGATGSTGPVGPGGRTGATGPAGIAALLLLVAARFMSFGDDQAVLPGGLVSFQQMAFTSAPEYFSLSAAPGSALNTSINILVPGSYMIQYQISVRNTLNPELSLIGFEGVEISRTGLSLSELDYGQIFDVSIVVVNDTQVPLRIVLYNKGINTINLNPHFMSSLVITKIA